MRADVALTRTQEEAKVKLSRKAFNERLLRQVLDYNNNLKSFNQSSCRRTTSGGRQGHVATEAAEKAAERAAKKTARAADRDKQEKSAAIERAVKGVDRGAGTY